MSDDLIRRVEALIDKYRGYGKGSAYIANAAIEDLDAILAAPEPSREELRNVVVDAATNFVMSNQDTFYSNEDALIAAVEDLLEEDPHPLPPVLEGMDDGHGNVATAEHEAESLRPAPSVVERVARELGDWRFGKYWATVQLYVEVVNEEAARICAIRDEGLREALLITQWHNGVCPVCLHHSTEGHQADCKIGAALAGKASGEGGRTA